MNARSRISPELLGRLRPFRDEALKRGIPAIDVERWIGAAARPCAVLSPHGDGPVVGHFGGPLLLPPDAPDPYYPFLASLDCAALPAGATDLPLPGDGRLLLFAFPYDPYGPIGGGQAVYVPADASVEEREAEYQSMHFYDKAREIVEQYPQGDAHLTINVSLPHYEFPDVSDYFCSTLFREHPYSRELSTAWDKVLQQTPWGPLQLGGYAWADGDNGGARFIPGRSAGEDGNEWVLLADWFADIGHFGGPITTVHWPIRWTDLTARRFDEEHAVVSWNPG